MGQTRQTKLDSTAVIAGAGLASWLGIKTVTKDAETSH